MPEIRRLDQSYCTEICAHYGMVSDETYIAGRLKEGAMYGAFLEKKLVGFIGMHEEGSTGMLEVYEEYRVRKIGKALDTYLINLQLEQGYTPFGQVVKGNEVSARLQQSLGLYMAKSNIYWME